MAQASQLNDGDFWATRRAGSVAVLAAEAARSPRLPIMLGPRRFERPAGKAAEILPFCEARRAASPDASRFEPDCCLRSVAITTGASVPSKAEPVLSPRPEYLPIAFDS